MTRQEKLIGGAAIAFIIVGLASYIYIPKLLISLESPDRNLVGIIISGAGELKMRLGDTANWRNLKLKDPVYSQAYLFTGPKSSAKCLFLDESTMTLNENSLAFIDFDALKSRKSNHVIDINLIDGKLVMDLSEKNNVSRIKVDGTTIDVTDKKTKIVIGSDKKLGVDIAVYQGDVDINHDNQNINLKAGEKISVTQNEFEKEPIDEDLLNELNRIADEDRKRITGELRKEREFSAVLKKILESTKEFLK